MCRERNIKGCLRWVHQGLLFITTAVGSKATSSKYQSLCDFPDQGLVSTLWGYVTVGAGARRRWPVSARDPPTRQSSTWLFSATCRLHLATVYVGGSLGLGLWSERSTRGAFDV